jgi:hypothetical protein
MVGAGQQITMPTEMDLNANVNQDLEAQTGADKLATAGGDLMAGARAATTQSAAPFVEPTT